MTIRYRASPDRIARCRMIEVPRLDPGWWMVLLVLASALILGFWSNNDRSSPTKQTGSQRPTVQAPSSASPSAAELIPIITGGAGGNTSLGGNVSLGGGSH